jgi:hypothetical protein
MAMQCWIGSALALALMLAGDVGLAVSLGPDSQGAAEAELAFAPLPGTPRADALLIEAQLPDAFVLTPVPEPTTVVLVSMGMGGLAVFGSRRRPRTH